MIRLRHTTSGAVSKREREKENIYTHTQHSTAQHYTTSHNKKRRRNIDAEKWARRPIQSNNSNNNHNRKKWAKMTERWGTRKKGWGRKMRKIHIFMYNQHFVQMWIEDVEFKHVKRCIKAFSWIESDSEKPYDRLRHIKYTRSFSQ